LTARVTGRAEFAVTSYGDYNLGAKRADNFANSEVLMRFGAAYHFGATTTPVETRPADFRGPYVGVTGGLGALTTSNSGDRSPPRTLVADRAGSGQLAGLYAGYAVTLGHLYAAAEAGTDFGNVDWNIKRDPDRRLYSVTEDRTLSASLLGGYILPRNVLVYGRVGLAETRFANVYRGEDGGNVVRPDVDRSGLRLGAGVATPLSARTMLRVEYGWTRYGQYPVDYGSGVDLFSNADGVARVGVSLRF
jgi:opacity protein-like surface antigen